jgi:hypothetical protein
MHNVLFFLILSGLLVPNFGTFSYYFMTDVLHISQFTYSMLAVLAFIGLMAGSFMYEAYFAQKELRTLIFYGIITTMCFAPFSFSLVFRWNI